MNNDGNGDGNGKVRVLEIGVGAPRVGLDRWPEADAVHALEAVERIVLGHPHGEDAAALVLDDDHPQAAKLRSWAFGYFRLGEGIVIERVEVSLEPGKTAFGNAEWHAPPSKSNRTWHLVPPS